MSWKERAVANNPFSAVLKIYFLSDDLVFSWFFLTNLISWVHLVGLPDTVYGCYSWFSTVLKHQIRAILVAHVTDSLLTISVILLYFSVAMEWENLQ